MRISTSSQLAACLILAAAAVLGAPEALASSSTRNVKISDCNKALSRPKSVTLTCADAGVVLMKLSWSSFGGSSARATGQIAINGCEPNCAAGKTKSYPVKVVASRPKSCKGKVSVYGDVAVTFTGAKPKDASGFTHETLACPS